MTSKITIEQKLFIVANKQLGYFTSKQAQDCGYAKNNHSYYVKNKHWIKEEIRGIYRLYNYPASEYEQLMIYYLWSFSMDSKPRGVYSHQTALSIYELSDINPNKLHMTVPKNFTKKSQIPEILILHKPNIQKNNITTFNGVAVTTVIKTLLDIIKDNTIEDIIKSQAVNEAYKKALISRTQIEANPSLKLLIEIK